MFFNIRNYFKFASFEEAACFLDLPTDTNILKEQDELSNKRIKLLNKGIKFRVKSSEV